MIYLLKIVFRFASLVKKMIFCPESIPLPAHYYEQKSRVQ